MEKIETFTPAGVESGYYINGERVGDINERLNFERGKQAWLSLRPKEGRYFKEISEREYYFGELNDDNLPHGRGIHIYLGA